MSTRLSDRILSLSLLLLLGILWGTGYAIARFVITHDIPAISYSFWESLGPAILLSVIALSLGRYTKRAGWRIQHTHLRYYFTAGLTGIAIPNTCMYFAAGHLPAGLLAVMVNTVPVFAWPLALLSGLERFNFARLSGLLLAVLGLLFILIPKASLPAYVNWPWFLLSLVTPLSFAFCAVYIAKYRPIGSGPIAVAAGMMCAATGLLIPLVALTGGLYVPTLPLGLPDIFIIIETILSSLGYVLFFELLRIAGPVYYSLVDTTVALTGLASGYFIFNEKISHTAGLGIILILIGVLLVTLKQNWGKKNTPQK